MTFTIDETRWRGARYYTVEPRETNIDWYSVIKWCATAFGTPGDVWSDKADRYYFNSGKVFFREQTDLSMFVLKNS